MEDLNSYIGKFILYLNCIGSILSIIGMQIKINILTLKYHGMLTLKYAYLEYNSLSMLGVSLCKKDPISSHVK